LTDDAQIRRHLTDIPDLFSLLPLFTGLTSGSGEERMATLSTRSKPPVSLALVDLTDTREKPDADLVGVDVDLEQRAGGRRQGVLPTLASEVRLVDAELWDHGIEHDPPSTTPSVATECAFLLVHLDWIVTQQWADEVATVVRGIWQDLRQAVGDRDPLTLVCNVPGCGWGVADLGDYFRCSGCGKTTGRLEAHKYAIKMQPKTIRQCADQLKVSVRTLRKLDVRHVAMGPGKVLLYNVQDMSAALAEYRLRPA
jgi:hypothetical protein